MKKIVEGNNEKSARIFHPFGPLYNENSRVLILGSFPSVKSREQEFFYGHPQNRFWKVMGALFGEPDPDSIRSLNGTSVNSNRETLLKMHEGGDRANGQQAAYIPRTIEEKKALILDNGLALWDSIGSCEITGSSDASIRNAEPNDLRIITGNCDIRAIYCNGKKSLEVYNRYIEPVLGRPAKALPSTSPANAAWSLERLIEAWAVVKDNLL